MLPLGKQQVIFRYPAGAGRGDRRGRGSLRAFPGIPFYNRRTMKLRGADLEIVATAGFGIYLAYIGRNGPWTPQHVGGAVLIAAGFTGWLIARLQIREFFTPRAEARGLVTTGIYSKIRNPIYFFGLVFFAGIILYMSVPLWGLVLMALIIHDANLARAK